MTAGTEHPQPGHDLTDFGLSDMIACAAALRELGDGAKAVEDYAEAVVDYLHRQLRADETNVRQTVLVRFYKTHRYDDLGGDLQLAADSVLGDVPAPPGMKCLTLLASAGTEAAWNSRRTSVDHRAIPLPSATVVAASPMIYRLIQQFGMDVGAFLESDQEMLVDAAQTQFNVFHVPVATASPYVPAQDFVEAHGVSSVLGFGGMLPTGDLFAVIMFTAVAVTRETAQLFQVSALSLKVALLPLLDRPLFRDSGVPDVDEGRRADGVGAQNAALRDLLEVHERVALAESRAAATAMRELTREATRYATLARTLQESLLPQDLPAVPGVGLAAVYRPAGDGSEVGGDFYDVFPVRRGTWGLVVGDVSGKGAAAAALTALARHTVRAAALRATGPVEVLSELNEAVNREHGESEKYVTAVFAMLRRSRSGLLVSLSVAGMPPPLLLSREGDVTMAGRPGMPLGLFQHVELEEDTVELQRGAALLLHTDGVNDARDPSGEFFGERRIRELLSSLAGRSALEVAERFGEALMAFQHDVAQDDTALLVVRVRR